MFAIVRRSKTTSASLLWLLASSAVASAGTPSFNCAKARQPAELAVCSSDALAALDNMVAAAYLYMKATRGRQAADLLAGPLLMDRYKCGFDQNCIASSYRQEINAFRAVGVPIGLGDVQNSSSGPVVSQSVAPGLGSALVLEVPLVGEGGTYSVPVAINGQITLNFIVDSGASDVSIPADVVTTLIRTKTITDQDFLGSQTYVLADGSKAPSERFNIRSLRVGDKILENVTASIAPATGPLLLGQSFLNRFGSWAMDNNRHVLVLSPIGEATAPDVTSVPASGANSPVQAFYTALQTGDGEAAASFILPEKRTGPFAPEAMTNYYRNLVEPLRLGSVVKIDDTNYLATYQFRDSNRACHGKSVVSTTTRSGITFINSIHAINGC